MLVFLVSFVGCVVLSSPATAAAATPTRAAASADTTEVPATEEPPITILGGRSVSDCVSSNPKPGCTTARNTDGHQLAVLGVMFTAIIFISWRVTRSIRRRDRSIAAH